MSATNDQRYVVAEVKASEPLNRQVWEHEAIAKRDGLKLVIELFTKKQPTSKALSKLWKKRDQVVTETLSGIYLLRVNVADVGLKASLALTPYTIFGVPLFIAWNPLAQLLTNKALNSSDTEPLLATLSAFFEDVANDRKHTLHPAPRLPFGSKSVASTAKAKAKRSRAEGSTTEAAALPQTTASATPPLEPATPKELATEAPQHSADPTGQPRTAVLLLEADLALFLENALAVAVEFLLQSELRADGSLHSLRQLDAFLDENKERTRSPEFVAQSLAALGVYLGMVIQTNANATWFVDAEQASPIDALGLRVSTPDGEQIFCPVALALERLHDSSKGFYGHAVALCRTL
jgi:hypothetical protein